MSHFTVLVIGDNIDGQLAPYDESLEMPERINGEVTRKEKLEFINHYSDKEYKVVKEDVLKELYEKHGDHWNGNRWRNNADGVLCDWTTYNPDSKWDWYVIGGRWKDSLLHKNGGLMDSLLKGDLDSDKMRAEARVQAEENYEIVREAFGGSIPVVEPTWSECLARVDSKELTIEQARDLYHTQEALMLKKELIQGDKLEGVAKQLIGGWNFDLEKYQVSKEEYGERAYNSALSFYAVLKDGVWYEKGSMGWWGISHNEKDQNDWNTEVKKLIDACADETPLTVVDCHI